MRGLKDNWELHLHLLVENNAVIFQEPLTEYFEFIQMHYSADDDKSVFDLLRCLLFRVNLPLTIVGIIKEA